MILTREQALEYHRQMWYDMREDLGDCPSWDDRMIYKHKWCRKKFPKELIGADCFLCEYALQAVGNCDGCPIDWGGCGICCQGPFDAESEGGIDWRISTISEILALPEKRRE